MAEENSLLTLLFEAWRVRTCKKRAIHTSHCGMLSTVHLNVRKATTITAKLLVTSVTSKKEKNSIAVEVTASLAGRLPL
jgi:hypothetical protein